MDEFINIDGVIVIGLGHIRKIRINESLNNKLTVSIGSFPVSYFWQFNLLIKVKSQVMLISEGISLDGSEKRSVRIILLKGVESREIMD